MKNIKIEKVILNARSGSQLTHCIKESFVYAAEMETAATVVLIHNDKEYFIDVNEFIAYVENEAE